MTDGAGNWITYNGEIYNYLELRDELGAARLPDELRHRGHPARATTAGARTALDAPPRHVRLRALGRAGADASSAPATASASSRSTTPSSTASSTSPPRQGAAAVPAGDRDRPRRASRTTSPSSSASAARRCSRASTSCCRATSCRVRDGHGRDAALLGGLLRARLRPHRAATSRSSISELLARLGPAAPARRRAGRRVRQRRPRLEHRRVARRDAHGGRSFIGVHRPVRRRARTTTRARYARDARRARAASSCTRSTIGAQDFVEQHPARSSTTSTTRSPGPGSFPQYMVSRARRASTRKVVLGGQGGDEIFGGYARYLIAYFEQCIKARDRRDDAQRQLRRHVRVDHPEPRRRCANTSRCCRSSGARGSSTTSTRATSA